MLQNYTEPSEARYPGPRIINVLKFFWKKIEKKNKKTKKQKKKFLLWSVPVDQLYSIAKMLLMLLSHYTFARLRGRMPTKELYSSIQRWNRSGFSRPDQIGKFLNLRRSTGF